MLIEVQKHKSEALAVRDAAGLRAFMEKYYAPVLVPDFPGDALQTAKKANPLRLQNPDYFTFYALVISGVAQFGFISAEGQYFRHQKREFVRDFMDPRHILALGCYLSDLNIQAYKQKTGILEELRASGIVTPEREEAVWAATDLYVDSGIARISYTDNRHRRKRPSFDVRRLVLLPDIEHHRKSAAIKFTGHEADTMSRDRFVQSTLPLIEAVYGEYFDVSGIFLNSGESWDAPQRSDSEMKSVIVS
jgi:hypothetical protein